MAIRKNTAEATEVVETAVNETAVPDKETAAGAKETEKGAQDKPQAVQDDPATVKLVYIGPTLPKSMLKSNKILTGTREEIRKELSAVIEKLPLVEKMLVPVEGLAEKKKKVATTGNILNKYYSDLVSASAAIIKEE